MRELDRQLKLATGLYARGEAPIDLVLGVASRAISILHERAEPERWAECDGKDYWVFRADGRISRPYLPTLFEASELVFRRFWGFLIDSADPDARRFHLDVVDINRVLYSAIGSFAICYDLWKSKSRKTPGTFFEVLLGSVLKLVLPRHQRAGHVTLPGQVENVSTDIVFQRQGVKGGLVVPAKITTRERVVQPFAHQRILDSVFGENVFKSTLVCMSEMQRDDDRGAANAICVPGTIRLFQMHLARLSGIYYLDPPARYLLPDVTQVIRVATLGDLLAADLHALTET